MAIPLNLGAMSVFFFLITYLCVHFLLMRLPTIIQATKCAHIVMLFYFSPRVILLKVECLLY